MGTLLTSIFKRWSSPCPMRKCFLDLGPLEEKWPGTVRFWFQSAQTDPAIDCLYGDRGELGHLLNRHRRPGKVREASGDLLDCRNDSFCEGHLRAVTLFLKGALSEELVHGRFGMSHAASELKARQSESQQFRVLLGSYLPCLPQCFRRQ